MRGYLRHSWLFSFHNYSLTWDLGGAYVKTLITYVSTGSVQLLKYQCIAPGKPASKAQFPSPPSLLLCLWTQQSEEGTWNNVQHIFPWTRIEHRKETICILEILFCRKSMCQEHMCWMNLGKAVSLLCCLRKITFNTSVRDWHGLFISI